MKLYQVYTTAKEYHGCRRVVFKWFRSDAPAERRHYAKLIENYKSADPFAAYAEGFIDELLAKDEALQLKEYLDRVHGDEGPTTIKEMRLPIPNSMMGYRGWAIGGGDDFYMLHKEPKYSLSFKVEGYFNLVGRELVDGPGVYHHRLFLLSPDGKMRMQTNEEAAAMARAYSSGDRP